MRTHPSIILRRLYARSPCRLLRRDAWLSRATAEWGLPTAHAAALLCKVEEVLAGSASGSPKARAEVATADPANVPGTAVDLQADATNVQATCAV